MSELSAGPVVIHAGGEPDAVAERRARRRRTLIVLASISIGWKVLLFTVGAAVPRWLLTDGVAELPARHQAYGAASLATASALFDMPAERLTRVVQRVRVVGVDSTPGVGCAIGARVRAYTYFAIPYSEVRTRCDTGVVEYRVFRPAAGAD